MAFTSPQPTQQDKHQVQATMPSKTFSILFSLVAAATGALQVAHGATNALSQVAQSKASQATSNAIAPTASSTAPQAADFGCDTDNASPLFRAYSSSNTDHFYTTDYNEMRGAIASDSYVYQGVMGLIFRLPSEGTTLLYRGFNPNVVDHFLTISQDEVDYTIAKEGYLSEGTGGHAYTTQVCGSIPLYHLFSPAQFLHDERD
ncbi:hypothetical protein FOMPIDRAFT_1054516 [Fomitopsis schrenkii]|uniref:DUF5648 domain-containing protein n=1 Tax=Fomitopsis schrenkii TaxID=2126942 RepID=S8DUZ9_FOMSC|nr:hypothetical protein FOMPIDRAFT_1054516 [Fomitopsis schrenkii]